jgi:tetratricopeptide (TPR) repeat protein
MVCIAAEKGLRSDKTGSEVIGMKKIVILLMAGLAVLLISCATPPEQPIEEPEPPVDTTAPLPEKELEEAKSLKTRVDNNGLSEFALEDYQQAEKSLQEGEAAYSKDNTAAKKALDAAIQSYKTVISKALPLKTGRSQAEVDTIKSNAESIKAPVAMKAEYTAAKAKYDEAVAAKDAGNFEPAISLFAEAKSLFQDVYEKTKEKKEAAEAELGSTQDGIKDAEEKARAADDEIQGGGE